ncbi:MAG: YeeE/YedE family protein [Myxococcales bacterium]|nr:YeeE/YedE family protein [Myxococcales bacterium]
MVTKRDLTKVKALGVAIALQMALAPAILLLGPLSMPSFFPLGVLLGGVLFGFSMWWAGGCAASVLAKTGGGSLGALVAVAGMAAGATAFEIGPLASIRRAIQAVGVGISGVGLSELGPWLWAVTAPIGVGGLLLLWRTKTTTAGEWTWKRTGLLLGALSSATWGLAALLETGYGLSVVPGTVDITRLAWADSGGFRFWESLMALGVPAGALIAAGKKVKLDMPARGVLLKRLLGGLGLGAGSSLAVGCTVGHSLAGTPFLGVAAVGTTVAIFLGVALNVAAANAVARPAAQQSTSR